MKRTLIATTMAIGLGAGFALAPTSTVFAQTTGAETETVQKDWLDEMNTRINLAQAKVALLRARVALQIEKAPEQASQALAEAEAQILGVVETVADATEEQLRALAADIRDVRDTMAATPGAASDKIDDLVVATETRLLEYKQAILETEEAQLLQRRYALIEAQAALLRAQVAEKADETGETAQAHLDNALAWYQSTQKGASEKWQSVMTETADDIEAAKRRIAEERDHAAGAISALAERAADAVRGTDTE